MRPVWLSVLYLHLFLFQQNYFFLSCHLNCSHNGPNGFVGGGGKNSLQVISQMMLKIIAAVYKVYSVYYHGGKKNNY